MKMSIAPPEMFGSKQQVIVLEHGTEMTYWDAANFYPKTFSGEHDWCKHINAYWKRLPMEKQASIWEVYGRIHQVFEHGNSPSEIINKITPMVAELNELHPIEELSTFLAFHAPDVVVPTDMDEIYTPKQDTPTTREKTYTRPDYQKLLALVLGLRTMLPIWGQFIHATKAETGTNFKELYAFRLLSLSKYMNCEPMEKLKVYVKHNIRPDNTMQQAIMQGVASTDYPEWLLSLVVVRRVSLADLAPANPKDNLARYIYNFIVYKVGNETSTNFGESIRKKEFEAGDPNNDNNASRIEGYKIKQEYSVGEIAALEHWVDNLEMMARQLDANVDIPLLARLLQAADDALQNEILNDGQIGITQWVLSPVFCARGIMHLSKRNTIRAMALAQTWLWQHGHHQLACLITATAASSGNQQYLSGDGSGRIHLELQKELQKLFPYLKVSSSRVRTKPVNVAVQSIDAITQHLKQRDWMLNMPKELLEQAQIHHLQMRYSCPYDIKSLLAELAIQVAKAKRPISIDEDWRMHGRRPSTSLAIRQLP